MRIIRYLMGHKAALFMVALMFCIQAMCDLALPTFTADIVDVGIQQSGIANSVPIEMSADTYDAVLASVSPEDSGLIEGAYVFDTATGTYKLQTTAEKAPEGLDGAIMAPLVRAVLGEETYERAIAEDELNAAVGGDPDAILEQQGILAVKAEYEKIDVDTGSIQISYLWHVGLLMLAVTLLACITHCIMNYFACRTSAQIGRDLRSRFFSRVLDFSHREINAFSAASLITRATNDITQIQQACLMSQRMLIYSPIIAIGGIIMVSQTNVSMGWTIVLTIACVVVFAAVLFAITMPKFKIMQELIDRVNLVAREMLTGMSVIRAFNREETEEERFEHANRKLMDTQMFAMRAMSFMMPFMSLIMSASGVLIVWVGSGFIDAGVIQTGDMIAFITYSMLIVSSFLILGLVAIILPRANVAAARIDEVLATPSSIREPEEPSDAPFGEGVGVEIEFDHVTFHYEEDSGNVIDDVSFVVEPGETCAIIGPTGCGKTTVMRLIERFYDVSEGAVRIDGIDVRDLSLRDLRGSFGYVPQQSFLFTGTIGSNVAYSDEDMDEAKIAEALDIAQAADFVADKADGMDSAIAQGGTNVSGGQRQRLAIARAIAADVRGFLFDDSFSALDYKTDALLRNELQTKLAGRTVLIVAQRIASVMHADHIVVMDEGRIVGQGTHDELLESCDIYRDIAISQLSEEELSKGGEQIDGR